MVSNNLIMASPAGCRHLINFPLQQTVPVAIARDLATKHREESIRFGKMAFERLIPPPVLRRQAIPLTKQ
jgi:hypothetical protein